ncbi:MAG TPA: hypothetical protein VFN71_07025 [Methylomirabilota bacterium]|nr:hypothetical protein [Methylomirabilota bacterium]
MANSLRALARRLLGVTRVPTYYLPWLTRPGLECTLVLHNVEARFKPGYNEGPFAVSVTQYDADSAVVRSGPASSAPAAWATTCSAACAGWVPRPWSEAAHRRASAR